MIGNSSTPEPSPPPTAFESALGRAVALRVPSLSRNARLDPTRTSGIRRSFVADVRRRWGFVSSLVHESIAVNDALRLRAPDIRQRVRIQQKFEFAYSAFRRGNQAGFNMWLEGLIDQVLLQVQALPTGLSELAKTLRLSPSQVTYLQKLSLINSGEAVPWTGTYLKGANTKGFQQAVSALQLQGLAKAGAIGAVTPAASFLRGVLQSSIFDQSRIAGINARNFHQLRAITADMSAKIGGVLATGVAQGLNPQKIARNLVKQVGLSRNRAIVLARTEVVRAHADATLDTYEAFGITDVEILAEWVTAGDERVCVVDGRTKALTVDGWKPISKVSVGDSVLTHKDRFRAVTATSRHPYKGPATKLFLGIEDDGNEAVLFVTSEHLIRSGDRWVPAGSLKPGDSVWVSAVPCESCGKLVPSVGRRPPKVCSLSCASRKGNRVRWSKPGAKARHRRQNQKRWGDPAARAAQSERMLENQPMDDPAIRERMADTQKQRWADDYDRLSQLMSESNKRRIAAGTHPFVIQTSEERAAIREKALKAQARSNYGGSFIERKVRWFLEKQGIGYEPQWYYKYDGGRRAFADFYLPGPRVVIECDGPGHLDRDVRATDQKKDAHLRSIGVEPLRFTDVDIRQRFADVASQIREHCCLMEVPLRDVQHTHITRSGVFDITVEEDESFVARGIVVHNCPQCEALQGNRFSIQEAKGMIPIHPQCRCSWVPYQQKKKARKVPAGKKWDPTLNLAETERGAKFLRDAGFESSGLKADVQKIIGGRLAASNVTRAEAEAFLLQRQPQLSAEILSRKSALEIYEMAADRLTRGWAITSMDADATAIALQLAAQEEFALQGNLTYVRKRVADVLRRADGFLEQHRNLLRAYLRAVYEETQAALGAEGIEFLTFHRGMKDTAFVKLSLVFREAGGAAKWGEVALQPLSSFSTDLGEAMIFGENMTTIRVPASHILSTPRTGLGCLGESEFVIMSRNPTYTAVMGQVKQGAWNLAGLPPPP